MSNDAADTRKEIRKEIEAAVLAIRIKRHGPCKEYAGHCCELCSGILWVIISGCLTAMIVHAIDTWK